MYNLIIFFESYENDKGFVETDFGKAEFVPRNGSYENIQLYKKYIFFNIHYQLFS